MKDYIKYENEKTGHGVRIMYRGTLHTTKQYVDEKFCTYEIKIQHKLPDTNWVDLYSWNNRRTLVPKFIMKKYFAAIRVIDSGKTNFEKIQK